MAAFCNTGYMLQIYILLLLSVISSVSAFTGVSTNNLYSSATLLHALRDEVDSKWGLKIAIAGA